MKISLEKPITLHDVKLGMTSTLSY